VKSNGQAARQCGGAPTRDALIDPRDSRRVQKLSVATLVNGALGLRAHDVFELGFDLNGGEAGGIPTTAEGFDEKDGRD